MDARRQEPEVDTATTADEVRRLRAAVNDLISILALPALWDGGGARQIGNTLADSLLGMLRPAFVYLQLVPITEGEPPIEVVRTASQSTTAQPEEIRKALAPWLNPEAQPTPLQVANPVGEGNVSVIARRLGLRDEFGVLVIGCERPDFPDETEKLVIDIAANEAVIGLQDAQRLTEQRRLAEELERRVAERTNELQRSQQYLREVVDTIPQQIWSGPPDGTLDFCNARWRSELGLRLEDIQGNGWQQILHPDDRDRVLRAWQRSVETGAPYEQQERHRMANGEFRWFLCRGIPLRDEHGNIVRWFGSNTDIHDQKAAEEALRKSEQRWRAVFDNSRVGVALLGPSLSFVGVNPAFEKMVGYQREELRKTSCLDVTFEADRTEYKLLIDELREQKRDWFEIEKRVRRKDGQLIWVRLNASRLTPSDRELWVGIVEDVTDRKRLTEELRQDRDRLHLLLELNKKFVSQLDIHDFFETLSISLREIVDWEYSFVALPESARDLKVHLGGPGTGQLRIGMLLPIEGTIAGRVYRSRKPEFFRVADLHPLPDHPELTKWREFARAEGLQAGCNLPLLYNGDVLGVLGFHTRRDLDSARGDFAFLQELAKLVAIALHNALQYGELSQSNERLSYQKDYIEADFLRDRGIAGIVGDSPAIAEVVKQINAVAPTESTVLITGETGTGKELVARAIHARSARRDRSFIKVDCAAIPSALMESELFGHEKGAFTGATAQKLGRFEIADKGTLFLDEVGDIPLELQTKLLRVLQDHAFERVGSNRTIKVDVRIIAATHRNLEVMVEQGTFREDLYYRLKVFPITVPPLRDRSGDIPALVKHYVRMYARRMKKDVAAVSPAAMEIFQQYPWPGNVRELQHFIERSVVLTSGRQLQAPLAELQRFTHRHARRAQTSRTLEEIERDAILQALEDSNWIVGGPHGAAVKLGVKRTTLASRMEKLGITRHRRMG